MMINKINIYAADLNFSNCGFVLVEQQGPDSAHATDPKTGTDTSKGVFTNGQKVAQNNRLDATYFSSYPATTCHLSKLSFVKETNVHNK
jgi:hypothetical protein